MLAVQKKQTSTKRKSDSEKQQIRLSLLAYDSGIGLSGYSEQGDKRKVNSVPTILL